MLLVESSAAVYWNLSSSNSDGIVVWPLWSNLIKWVPPRTISKSVITVPSRRFPPAAILLLELHSVIVVSISASCFNREPRGG